MTATRKDGSVVEERTTCCRVYPTLLGRNRSYWLDTHRIVYKDAVNGKVLRKIQLVRKGEEEEMGC